MVDMVAMVAGEVTEEDLEVTEVVGGGDGEVTVGGEEDGGTMAKYIINRR
jgi:hypothetical protein